MAAAGGTMLVDGDLRVADANIVEAAKNVPRSAVQLVPQIGCSVYGLLRYQRVVMSMSAIEALEARLASLQIKKKRERLEDFLA